MVTLPAMWMVGVRLLSSLPFSSNLIFLTCRICVRHCSAHPTLRYSHDLQAKKKAPIASCVITFWHLVTAASIIVSKTKLGRTVCCFFLGSSALNARNCHDRRKEGSLSSSFVRCCRPFALKDKTRCEMEFWIVLSARGA